MSAESRMLEKLICMPRTVNMVRNVKSELDRLLKYDYQIGDIHVECFAHDGAFVKKKFGQVKTPNWVAELMVEVSGLTPRMSVLDPCFGDGTFLIAANRKARIGENGRLVGVELDPVSFAIGMINYKKTGGSSRNCSLYNGDIFDWNKDGFDVIIMNPPYIRQEELSDTCLNKRRILRKLELSGIKASTRSNLYSYFIMHLTKFLKPSGIMSVIIPKIWLDSQYGQSLHRFLLDNYDIHLILDFNNDTFPSAIVEDCILVIRKKSIAEKSTITRFVHVKKQDSIKNICEKIGSVKNLEDKSLSIASVTRHTLATDPKWGKFLHVKPEIIKVLSNEKMISLSIMANVIRGTTTMWNEFFIIRDDSVSDEFITPIINSPKDLGGFDTSINSNISSMLCVENSTIRKNIGEYVQNRISQKSNIPATVNKLMRKNPHSWYTTIRAKSGPIIFGYIIRRAKNFILNKQLYNVRDNFYIITPKPNTIDTLLLFGILNSSLVRLNLEATGRRYGNGTLKIQAYELANMSVPDWRLMSESFRNEIRVAAKELSQCSFEDSRVPNLIGKIDQCIHDSLRLRIDPKDVKISEIRMTEGRLQRPVADTGKL